MVTNMNPDKNNNGKIMNRIAKSNLQGNRMYSFFSMLTIAMAVCFIAVLVLVWQGTKTEEKQILDKIHHVMFMDITEQQIEELSANSRTEMLLRYKYNHKEFEQNGIKFKFEYIDSQAEKIATYIPTKGSIPEKEDEIVVDKKFMAALGKEAKIGETIELEFDNNTRKTFTVCGYTENEYEYEVYNIYVSRSYADYGYPLSEVLYTALVRIEAAEEMTSTEFKSVVYDMAAKCEIERIHININGWFQISLDKGNQTMYAMLLLSVIVLAAGAIVIYSIFYLSVSNRIQQIGQLMTIGMTQKQVKKMVRREGFFLSLIPIPFSLLVSGIIAYFINPVGWNVWNFIVIALLTGVFGIVIVQISIGKPAALAARVSPIEAANNLWSSDKNNKIESPHKMLTPFIMAKMGYGRDRKKTLLSTVSLALGGIIYMVGSVYMSSWDVDAYVRSGGFSDAEYNISYRYDAHNNQQTYGITELQMKNILNKDLEERLRNIPNVRNVQREKSAMGNLIYQDSIMLVSFGQATPNEQKYLEDVIDGESDYSYLVENDGFLVLGTDLIEEIYGVQMKVGDKVTLNWFDGTEREMELVIAGTSPGTGTGGENFVMAQETMDKIWGGMNTTSTLKISVENYEENGTIVEQEIEKILNEYPDLTLYTLREKKLMDSDSITKINRLVYGISIFIIMFSILNLINTIVSSIVTRKKELAMLESIGMSVGQIGKMLRFESFFIVLPNIFITLIAGTAAGYGLIAYIGNMSVTDYLVFSFPFYAVALYVLGILMIPILISTLCLKMQNKDSLVDRIKNKD